MSEPEVHGDGNVIGDQSHSQIAKTEIAGDVRDSTVITAGRDVHINVEREPSLPDPMQVLAHQAALAAQGSRPLRRGRHPSYRRLHLPRL
jgi:hypothetical protein